MKLVPGRRVLFLLLCLCGTLLFASAATSEPRAAASRSSLSNADRKATADRSSGLAAGRNYIVIPGPLRSFLRMSGISQEVPREDVLPLFGHFVESYGYEGSNRHAPKPTEALILFKRYFAQSQRLAALAGPDHTIRFSSCEEAKPLLEILGYRLAGTCADPRGLRVQDPDKAFSTVDSGFPLADVEQALLLKKPFSTDYHSVRLPLIYTKLDWTGEKDARDETLIDSIADNVELARLYWALSRIDEQTRDVLKKSLGIKRMLPLAPVLDFYGCTLSVRAGRVAVPGGPKSDLAWAQVVGANPNRPAAFLTRLLEKDHGSVAEFYDAIARAPNPQLAYLTDDGRLRRFYEAFHDHDRSDDAVHSSFRPGPQLLLLVTRFPLDSNGEPLVPGGLGVWKAAFSRRPPSKAARERPVAAGGWTTPEQLLEGLFGLSRSYSEDGPLDMYLSLTEIDRQRGTGQGMSAPTVKLLMSHFAELHDQYEIFIEFAGLDDTSINQFVVMTQKIDRIHDPLLRGDMMGIFQANLGLWQIFARQGQIGATDLNDSWRRIIAPFGHAENSAQLFDAGRASLAELMKVVDGTTDITQERIVDLLAGPAQSSSDGQQVHDRLAAEIAQVISDQRLVSLDTLFYLADDFGKMGHNPKTVDLSHGLALASQLQEARGPRPMFTNAERSEWAPEEMRNEHILREMRTDPTKLFNKAEHSGKEACASLTPYLRDTLVGLNYAYYQPPGSQILHDSPLLVRSHDFLASELVEKDQAWLAPRLFGAGITAANGARLSGSLAGLPYTLAEMQQDLIVPRNVQSLIWQGVAADILTASIVPRWWSTSPEALHAAALYQQTGEELIAAAAKDADLRATVADVLSNRLPSVTIDSISDALRENQIDAALNYVSPAAVFYLTAEFEKRFPDRIGSVGSAGRELRALVERDPAEVNPQRLSEEFGIPHPLIDKSYRDDLLNVKLFPSIMGYGSDLLAESWESTNLYWARLADQAGYSPAMLNELAPRLASNMVAIIFGSDFDDWPALNRALRQAGREFRARQTSRSEANAALQPEPAN
jgi:hypothetical protein